MFFQALFSELASKTTLTVCQNGDKSWRNKKFWEPKK